MGGKTSNASKRKYNEKSYDRIYIIVPRGHKGTIENAAKAAGESVNLYTQKAILQRMGITEWPDLEDKKE